MRLLILTQAVDLNDPVLGFFHRWITEFASRYDSIEVICLKAGRYDLPKNVHIHSLGKEGGVSRIKYIARFYRYIWQYRNQYDSVFVHMNQEYVLLGGLLWKTLGKKIVLWRNHKVGSWMTQLAGLLSNAVCYTSPAAYVTGFKNAVIMPIGIDTDFFKPAVQLPPKDSILFLGRLDPVKRPDIFIDALQVLSEKGTTFTADIVGDPSKGNEQYAHDIRNRAAPLALDGSLRMSPGVTNEAARDLFATHAMYINLTPSGSFDKTIGEAMACGSIVITPNEAVRRVIHEEFFVQDNSVEGLCKNIQIALELDDRRRIQNAEESRNYIMREHSLPLLADRLMKIFS